jgi:hypothetical protein
MDEEDLYFSVAQFSEEGRNIDATMSSHWLWADLDRVGPDDCAVLGLTPTVCWESSPWRFQALWKLNAKLKPEPLARLNKALTYAIGADRGGWDLTQVLRPVGTHNWKHPGAPEVLLVYDDGPEYDWRELKDQLKVTKPGSAQAQERFRIDKRDKIPARARALLNTPRDRVVDGERSNTLWRLNCSLAEAGFEEDQIFDLVESCAWNKWPRHPHLLKKDIARAVAKVLEDREKIASNGGKHKDEAATTILDERGVVKIEDLEGIEEEEEKELELPFTKYSRFMSQNLEAPRWLVDNLWMAHSHGIIGGEAKSSKSLIAMAMGLAVASGRPFMGLEEFQVNSPGPVLMIQEENSPWDVQDKLMKLATLSGLMKAGHFPHDFPLMLLNNYGFDLSDDEHRGAIEDRIRDEGAVLLILDPLYLMLGPTDANHAGNVVPFQKWLLQVRHTYNCAIMLVHHFGKPRMENQGVRAGHRLLGSGTWYNWVESALYCQAMAGKGWHDDVHHGRPVNRRIGIEREWRSAPPQDAIDLRMYMSKPGASRMIVEHDALNRNTTVQELAEIVSERPGILITDLARAMSSDVRTARKYVVGSGKFRLEELKRGRGISYKVFPL